MSKKNHSFSLSFTAMIGPTLIPIVNYMGSEMIVLPLIVMGVLLIFGGFASFFLPETKNKSLPQTLFESDAMPLVNPFKRQRRQTDGNDDGNDNSCKLEKSTMHCAAVWGKSTSIVTFFLLYQIIFEVGSWKSLRVTKNWINSCTFFCMSFRNDK